MEVKESKLAAAAAGDEVTRTKAMRKYARKKKRRAIREARLWGVIFIHWRIAKREETK